MDENQPTYLSDPSLSAELAILEGIGIEVLGNLKHGAFGHPRVRVRSRFHKRTSDIYLGANYNTLLMLGGPPVRDNVIRGSRDPGNQKWTVAEVHNAMALISGFCPEIEEE